MMYKRLLYYIEPIIKLVVFVICFITCALPVVIIQQVPYFKNLNDKHTSLIVLFLFIFSVSGALYMFSRMFNQLTFKSFFIIRKDYLKGFLKGTLFGMLILTLCVILIVLIGNVSYSIGKISLALFLYYVLYFFLVALFEELFSRTYTLFVLAETYPILLAVVINGILFALLHATNHGFSSLAMLNLTFSGMIFSMFTLYYRSISWAVGIHLGWNFAQGILFGYKVSGNDTPGLLVAKPIGLNYLSGGEFGAEGSLICTIVLAIVIIYLFLKCKIPPIKEHI